MTKYHCCFNCKIRTIGCHSTCEIYLKEIEENKEMKKRNHQVYAQSNYHDRVVHQNKTLSSHSHKKRRSKNV